MCIGDNTRVKRHDPDLQYPLYESAFPLPGPPPLHPAHPPPILPPISPSATFFVSFRPPPHPSSNPRSQCLRSSGQHTYIHISAHKPQANIRTVPTCDTKAEHPPPNHPYLSLSWRRLSTGCAVRRSNLSNVDSRDPGIRRA